MIDFNVTKRAESIFLDFIKPRLDSRNRVSISDREILEKTSLTDLGLYSTRELLAQKGFFKILPDPKDPNKLVYQF